MKRGMKRRGVRRLTFPVGGALNIICVFSVSVFPCALALGFAAEPRPNSSGRGGAEVQSPRGSAEGREANATLALQPWTHCRGAALALLDDPRGHGLEGMDPGEAHGRDMHQGKVHQGEVYLDERSYGGAVARGPGDMGGHGGLGDHHADFPSRASGGAHQAQGPQGSPGNESSTSDNDHEDGRRRLIREEGHARGRGALPSDGWNMKVAGSEKPIVVVVKVKDRRGRYAISPDIYGVNEYGVQSLATLREAGIRVVRRGGNAESRYSWAVDTTNRGDDWFFEAQPNAWTPQPTQTGAANTFDAFVLANRRAGLTSFATIPLLPWLPKAKDLACSFNTSKYGEQQRLAPDHKECGNGLTRTGKPIKNDPADINAKNNASFQSAWVRSLVSKFGDAASEGVKYYSLDNEPVWWSHTHRDVHPRPTTYKEILRRGVRYAAGIKAADPTALVTGPVTSGWADTFYSMADMLHGWKNKGKYWDNPVDRRAHGNKPFLQYYLEGMRAAHKRTRRRLLDLVDVHFYGSNHQDKADPASQVKRIQATRMLWDPHFVCQDCDWMDPVTAPNGVPMFLRRVKALTDAAYPGTGLAVTEYTFGGAHDVSGAIAQAEVLGMFGRLGVRLATVHPGPTANTSVYQAFKMFGNYDGQGSGFGSLGVTAASSHRSAVSAYAAVNKLTRALTVLIINLTPKDRNVRVVLADVLPKEQIRVFRYSSDDLTSISFNASIPPSAVLAPSCPPYSLTMLEVPLIRKRVSVSNSTSTGPASAPGPAGSSSPQAANEAEHSAAPNPISSSILLLGAAVAVSCMLL